MNNNRVFLDIHAIQILPPSNMNRDDSGSPKTAQYGGVRRARVSSQAWKRAMRRYFAEYSSEDLGIRTKHIVAYVADQICKLDETVTKQDAMSLAEDALELAGQGIRVNAINPGLIPTNILDLNNKMFEENQLTSNLEGNYPLKRLGKPEDIAYGAIYLLSDASSWVTGTNLVIDGGFILN